VADCSGNPEINLGTGTMDRRRWAPVVDRWLEVMRKSDFLGRHLDVRENVKFFGGQLPRWINDNFPDSVCALAIEVKKFFMNEWTGELDVQQHRAIGKVLREAAQAVEDEIGANA
jgi:N-formylglutamate deformylase